MPLKPKARRHHQHGRDRVLRVLALQTLCLRSTHPPRRHQQMQQQLRLLGSEGTMRLILAMGMKVPSVPLGDRRRRLPPLPRHQEEGKSRPKRSLGSRSLLRRSISLRRGRARVLSKTSCEGFPFLNLPSSLANITRQERSHRQRPRRSRVGRNDNYTLMHQCCCTQHRGRPCDHSIRITHRAEQ